MTRENDCEVVRARGIGDLGTLDENSSTVVKVKGHVWNVVREPKVAWTAWKAGFLPSRALVQRRPLSL